VNASGEHCSNREIALPPTRRGSWASLCALLLAGILACNTAPAYERDKSDVVTLRRGDHISGDIVSMEYGVLVLKTDDMSTLNIEWQAVKSVSSKFAFGIEVRSGAKFYGPISTTPDGATLLVGSGADVAKIPMADIERISRYSPEFWDRITGNLSAGFSYAKSSGISVGNFNLNADYRSTKVDGTLTASSNVTDSPEEGRTQRDRIASIVYFLQPSRNLWSLLGSLERDQQLGIDARLLGGAALGRRFVQNSLTELTGAVGVVGTEEWATGGSGAKGSVEGFLGATWQVFKFTKPETRLIMGLALYPSLTESGRWRGTGNLSLIHKFAGDFTLGLEGYWSYDNRPPEETAEKSDYGVTFNLGYSFGG
jgi:hypothetical protein